MPPQFGASAGAPGGAWSPTDAWGFAWNVVIKRFGAVALPIAVGLLIAGLPGGIVYGGVMFMVQTMASEIEPDALPLVTSAGMGLSALLFWLIGAYMAGGFTTLALKAARGQPTSFGDLFSGGRFLGRFLVAGIVGGIAVGIGSLLCVIPGYIVAYGISLASFLIVDQDMAPVDALKRSWELTKGHKVNIFIFHLIGIAVVLAGYLACIIGVYLVSIPMMLIGATYIYLRIKGENPPAPT
jgi:uncharacterized membrane protein